MKYTVTVLFFSLLGNLLFAQNTKDNLIGNLIIYDVIIKDTNNNISNQPFTYKCISEQDFQRYVNLILNKKNIEAAIILNGQNKRVKNIEEFEFCYHSNDTLMFYENNSDKSVESIVQYNYLNISNRVIFKFYEKWSIDNGSLEIKKEVLAYSITANFEKFGKNFNQVLYTVVTDQNALNYLNNNGYFKP